MKLAVGILAAGQSKRLGQPKQLVHYQGLPLVVHQFKTADAVGAVEIFLTVGAHQAQVVDAIQSAQGLQTPLHILPVADYQSGMAASIRQLARTCNTRDVTHLLIMLVDQYLISTAHLRQLIDLCHAHANQAIATSVHGIRMPPAIFPRQWFDRLAALQGDQGAKYLLRDSGDVIELASKQDLGDIDVATDREKLS
jgi:molybdenum cofactor cytidylyltransferase